MKILLADDHVLVVEGIRSIIKQSFPGSEIAAFYSPDDVICEVSTQQYDLYVLDLEFRNATGVSGLDLIGIIRQLQPEAKIIVNTMHDEYWVTSRLLDMDLDGIVLKNASVESIVQAVGQVLKGKKYVSPEFRQIKAEFDCDNIRNVKLTDREQIVLKHIMQGLTASEIARKLFVTEDTIDYHKKNLFRKFNVRNSVELAVKATLQRWVE